MASLLDYDFNLDKMLGVTESPVNALLNNPNMDSQKNVAAGFGAIAPLISGYGKKSAAQILLEMAGGAKAGRQGVIDTATKGYMTQQDILKDTQDIQLNKYKLADAPNESTKLQNEILKLQNTNYLGSINILGVKSKFKRLQEVANRGGNGSAEALKQLELYVSDPQAYNQLRDERDVNNMEYAQGELSVAKLLDLDVKNRKNWTQQQEANFLKIIKAPNAKEAADTNRELLAAHREDPINVPYNKILNTNEEISKVLNKSNHLTSSTNAVQALPIGPISANEQYPEGAFKANNGKIYPKADWDNLGIELQDVYSQDKNRTELNISIGDINKNARTDYQSSQYGIRSIERTNLALERMLDNPEKFQKLFDADGRAKFKFNEVTGNFFAEVGSDAQDIVNQLNTIAGQQFTNEIQIMRQNNKTGGAVGNVSDKEVEMFKNMAASLRYSGSASELWYQLNLLRGQGKKTATVYIDSFNTYYGKEKSDRFRVNALMPSYKKEYTDNYQDALLRARESTVNNKYNQPSSPLPYTVREIKR